MKSHFSKIYQLSRIYQRAAIVHMAATGEYPSSFENLDIEMPAGMQVQIHDHPKTYASCAVNDKFYCCWHPAIKGQQSAGLTCGLKDYSMGYIYQYMQANGITKLNRQHCVAKTTNEMANQICAAYSDNPATGNLITPEGHKGTYYFYQM